MKNVSRLVASLLDEILLRWKMFYGGMLKCALYLTIFLPHFLLVLLIYLLNKIESSFNIQFVSGKICYIHLVYIAYMQRRHNITKRNKLLKEKDILSKLKLLITLGIVRVCYKQQYHIQQIVYLSFCKLFNSL